ncbi:cell wall hydrolase [Aliiroseovarius marinus]|uniref:cell wall hydrolase n=1 Tax=Aliiroseovarius marinus TaxID=2500159 RepID=UPI003D7C5966
MFSSNAFRAAAMAVGLGVALAASPVSGLDRSNPFSALLHQQKAGMGAMSGASIARFGSLPSAKPPQANGAEDGASPVAYTHAWLAAQPAPKQDAEWRCLSEALYFEARGETVKGQFAVAEVIMNRVAHARFPNTICGVINQGTGRKYACQFTYTCDGRAEVIHEPASFARVGKIARAVIDGAPRNLTAGATHYHTTAVSPRWASVFARTASIGVHRFYRMPG